MDAEDLVAATFPDQIACAENLVGEREIPDHPLVRQTIDDCLHEAMDIDGLERILARIEAGEIRVVSRDLSAPSPLALEVLTARPYAYLDDAPLEERRTQAVMSRRWLAPEAASELGRLDQEAIDRVRAEAWPDATNADELHDSLVWLGFLSSREAEANPEWTGWLAELARERRVTRFLLRNAIWVAAERLPQFLAVLPQAALDPVIAAPAGLAERDWSRDDAIVEIIRGRLEGMGPVGEDALGAALGLNPEQIRTALASLEAEGFAMRGRFTAGATAEEWCERRLLARIHRYTIKRLRAEIEPVAARDFLRFLCTWQRVDRDSVMEAPEALDAVVAQLEGFEAPAAAWESELLPARIAGYEPAWLDERCLAGRVTWARLKPRNSPPDGKDSRVAPVRTTPITLMPRRHALLWASVAGEATTSNLSGRSQSVADYIRQHGASFFDELMAGTGLLRSQVEDALAELVALGLVNSDSFAGLRALLVPSAERRPIASGRRRRRTVKFGMEDAGRWALSRRPARSQGEGEAVEHVARTLLLRYGVVFWRLLAREADWLPPWRDLVRVYRRLESRGEIRGGRFVAGFAGEQFALPDAVAILREVRRKPATGDWLSVSGADPLNLVGILTPGPKLPALTGNRLLYRDGIPVALFSAGEVQFLDEFDAATEWEARKALLRSGGSAHQVHPVPVPFPHGRPTVAVE
jgi:ATP-dependent Lhr-like helicase